jgi:hypothetical protein
MENMKRIHPAPGKRFQRVRELHSAREAAQLDRFLADTDPLLIASNCEEKVALAPPITCLRQWAGCRPPETRPMRILERDRPAGRTVKFLVTCCPSLTPPPPERSVVLLRAAIEWIEARLADGSMETTYLFPNRGGIAIMHADSHEELMELLLSYPAYPLYTWEVQVLADWRTGFENVMRFLEVSHGGPAEP